MSEPEGTPRSNRQPDIHSKDQMWIQCQESGKRKEIRRCEKVIHSAFISLASAGFHRLVTSDGV